MDISIHRPTEARVYNAPSGYEWVQIKTANGSTAALFVEPGTGDAIADAINIAVAKGKAAAVRAAAHVEWVE